MNLALRNTKLLQLYLCIALKLHICHVIKHSTRQNFLEINDDKGKSSSIDVSLSTVTTSMAHEIGLMN
jgi:hypothetical protein